MAIEKMKKLTILFPVREGEEIEEWLYSRKILHLTGIERDFQKINSSGNPLHLDEQEASEKLARVREIISENNSLHKPHKAFIDGMLPVKTVVTGDELREAIEAVDLDGLHAQVKKVRQASNNCAGRLNHLLAEKKQLTQFAFLSVPIAEIRRVQRVFLIAAEGSPSGIAHLSRDAEAAALLAWEVKRAAGSTLMFLFAGRKRDEEKCSDFLRAHGFRIIDYPEFDGRISDRLGEIAREEAAELAAMKRHQSEMEKLLPTDLTQKLECSKGYWESEKRRAERARAMLCSKRVGIARGYARAADVLLLVSEMEQKFPGVDVLSEDPLPGENVPVSIRLSRWWRPGQLMVTMFGLPDYFTLDPTPFLTLVFLLFFGICFADVVYGLMLVVFSHMLIKRYRRQENLREFFRLFLYGGVSTMIFGVITGSWAADIYNPEYLGQNNLLWRLVQKTTVLDMLAKPVIALVVALSIGVLTQFYGIIMRIIKDATQRNWQGVLFDGVLWLVYLGGLLMFAISFLSGVGGGIVKRASLVAVVVGIVGLILTQGRDQKGWPARIITGMVSLYGILGAYGTTSFVGDVLSYSRLLALGLNTYIVGMSFNIIAKITPQILISLTSILSIVPFLAPLGAVAARILSNSIVAAIIIAAVMIGGHLFNFIMSILSAFVHSARLILLEFFGRFYQTGGGWFSPHGFESESVEIVKNSS